MAMTEAEILRAWNIGGPIDMDLPYAGVSNHMRLVLAGRGEFVLRGYRHTRRERIKAEHVTIAHVRARGVPAPEVIPLPDGQTILERNGRFWALFRRIPGRQVRRRHISLAEVISIRSSAERAQCWTCRGHWG